MQTNKIIEYISTKFKDASCELNFNKDYELLIAVVLSAQTTDKLVNKATIKLFNKYPTLKDIEEAEIDDLKNILYSLGFTSKRATTIKQLAFELNSKYNGLVPTTKSDLVLLSGVGNKTANVFLNVYYDLAYLAVDTHVKRVAIRLGLADSNDSEKIIEMKLLKLLKEEQVAKFSHQILFFGRYHCLAKKPKCEFCELRKICLYGKEI